MTRAKKPKPKIAAKSGEVAKEEATTTKTPNEYMADPVLEDSYAHRKNILWTEYNNQYYPQLIAFQSTVREETRKLAQTEVIAKPAHIQRIKKAREDYLAKVKVHFENYISQLTLAYIYDQLRQNSLSPADLPIIKHHAKEAKTAKPKRKKEAPAPQ